jgi:hypothetical protein
MAKTNYSPTFPMFPGGAVTITPSDTVNLTNPAVIYVGVTGNVQVTTAQGDTVVFTAVPAGSVIPVQVLRVWVTNTTATTMVGVY